MGVDHCLLGLYHCLTTFAESNKGALINFGAEMPPVVVEVAHAPCCAN